MKKASKKKLFQEVMIAVLFAVITSLIVMIWLIWPSITTATTTHTVSDESDTVWMHENVEVRTGDSVTSIVRRIYEDHGVNTSCINIDVAVINVCRINNLTGGDYIYEGMELRVPYPVEREREED